MVDFIDEWISAPYPEQRSDRDDRSSTGLSWIEAEAQRRFGKAFRRAQRRADDARSADDICYAREGEAGIHGRRARFFARFRDLTAGGFYTTPVG